MRRDIPSSDSPPAAGHVLAPFSEPHVIFPALIWFFALNVPAALAVSLILLAESTANNQLSNGQAKGLIYASTPLLGFMLLWTVWWGCSSWRNWGWKGTLISAGIGSCVVLFGLMLASSLAAVYMQPDQPDPDTGAAVGLVFISVPVFVLLLLLLTIGALIAWVLDRKRRRKSILSQSSNQPR